MFDLREFVMNGLVGAIGRMEDFRIRLNAAGWHDKGVLSEEDLTMINGAIDARSLEVPPVEA